MAALLTWFLPGAGHMYLGKIGMGVIAFLVIDGMYLLGLTLADGMTFEFLTPELRSRFAPALSPEIANFGGFLWQMTHDPFGPAWPPSRGSVYMRPWPDGIRLGSLLTSLSGVANAILMVHAHLSARTAQRPQKPASNPTLTTALAFCLPGLGHWVQRRKLRGAIVFCSLMGLFVLGTVLAEGSNLSRERHFFYWAGQFLVGLPAILTEFAIGDMRIKHTIAYADAGLVFGCAAGLLNVLAMVDVYGFSESRLLGLPLKTQARPDAAEATT